MRKKDSLDASMAAISVVFDALAVFGGFMLATWVRFDTNLIPLFHGVIRKPEALYTRYAMMGGVATAAFLLAFRSLNLYTRPQLGRFETKIPRIIRAVGIGLMLTIVAAYMLQNFLLQEKMSTAVSLLALVTISTLVLLERWILYRIEWNASRHWHDKNQVLILGTDSVAARLQRTFAKEPMLRLQTIGFMQVQENTPDPDISEEMILGHLQGLESFIHDTPVDQIVLSCSRLPHQDIVDIILLCEQNLIKFTMVPDLFQVLTGTMDVQSIDDIPLLGVSDWPLDRFWPRVLKRSEDIVGAIFGLILSAPIIAISAFLIKRSSPGPVLYSQERCGREGKAFKLYKLRTMRVEAENESGPVFTAENDPRVTRIGAFLRTHNIDELPQLWNVLQGEMSLVGPRPERPHFVEQFKTDIGRYMVRHMSKPGMSGWAQVNGLRGNTSIEERIKYDLYYLEHWSLAFDFKILLRTVSAHENAY
jgi:exopolysaccharide biosynthesis polyprenyl glycosylphosphotransferase